MVVSGVDGCGLDHFSGDEFGRDDPSVRPFDRPDESAVAVPFGNYMERVVPIPLGADQDQHSGDVCGVISGVGSPFHHLSSARVSGHVHGIFRLSVGAIDCPLDAPLARILGVTQRAKFKSFGEQQSMPILSFFL